MNKSHERPAWIAKLKNYDTPVRARAIWQLVNTLVPYAAIVVLMYLSIRAAYPVWVTLLLSIPAAAFLMRIFVIFHDCVHGSFFASRRANRVVGTILGLFTFTSYGEWQFGHGVHHSTSGNLDRRTIGEVKTLTVDEYRASSRLQRLGYRIYRNPFFLFFIAPLLLFIVTQRVPHKGAKARQVIAVWITNFLIAGIVVLAFFTVGLPTYLLIQLPIMYFAGMAGIWLFYVQHQFDPGYWERAEEWDSVDSALEGSSYYKLPGILRWFSANIGLHHIHHLRPRIPNYNLYRCLKDVPELQLEDHLTIRASLRSVGMNLWDEANKRLIAFKDLRHLAASRGGA